jgi:polyhydroxyalkanoate synthase
MNIADDDQNPRPTKKLDKSLDAITALRLAMEQRLAEAQRQTDEAAAHQEAHSIPAPPPEPPVDLVPQANLEPQAPEAEPPADQEPPALSTEAPKEQPASAVVPTLPEGPEWPSIMLRVAERSQKLMLDYMERHKNLPQAPLTSGMPPLDMAPFAKAFAELYGRILNDPERFVDAQISLWQGYVNIWQATLARMQGKTSEDVATPGAFDKRFLSKEWQNNWLFDYLKQIYLLTTQQAQSWIRDESADLDPKLRAKIDFFMRQMVDAVSPNNFWLTNPDVLKATLETGGENLIKGLENLLTDLERGKGNLRISMTDENAFKVGENIAVTPGKVVFQNDLLQLIQYDPLTPTVHRVPLLIMPPWINKFYILDLRPKNSYVRYLVEKGYTVFVVSWVNPSAKHALVNFDDYMMDGAFASMREVRRITGESDINMVGYCIGGTLLASALAYLKESQTPPPDLPKVVSATYLVTLVDFAEPGDLGVFVDEDLVRIAEERMAKQGFLDASTMSTVFNLLRANDLIWSYVVNNYLLGKEPVPFDILYWNADSTNMPAVMQSFYLRKMYMSNKLVEPNGISMKGVPIDLRQIDTPSFLLSAREDHIAPWKSTYAATQIYRAPITFTLASSGHIAGVVNHPSANKYSYWTNKSCPRTADEWLKHAEEHKGSWWPEWLKWLEAYAGQQVRARAVGEGLESAPGSYVKVRAV